MKVLFLVNPSAGGRGAAGSVDTASRVFRNAGWEVSSVRAQSTEQAADLIESALEKGFDLLVLGGGDGTIHHCVQHLPLGSRENPSPLPFGIIPLGSGNDFFRGTGAPMDPEGAAQNIVKGAPRPIDIGLVEPINDDGSPREGAPVRFANTAGVGMDSQVLAARERAPRWMSARYELIFLLTLAGLYHLKVDLSGNDWRRELDAYWVLCCNNGFIGTGMHVAPDARIDDGLFDVLIIEKQSKLRFMFNLPRVFKGTHLEMDRVHLLRTRSLILKCAPKQRIAVDGDRSFESPAKITILPGAVTLRTM
jgi:YegS/Rv2252/BmrU family lipid kinase